MDLFTQPTQTPTPSSQSASQNNPSRSPTQFSDPSSPPSNNTSKKEQAPRIRRRNRMITSCLECRRRKLKCNKSHPCTNCTKFNRDCVFLAPALDHASQLKLTEIKEKVGSLERLLERDAKRDGAKGSSKGEGTGDAGRGALPDDREDYLPANEDERDLEPTPLAVLDAAYGEDGEDDDLLDLGIQMGKMRITERVGGFFRPKISQELEYTISDTPSQSPHSVETPLPPANEWLKPGPAYIAPSSGFFFSQGGHPVSLNDYLPSRSAADLLIKQYFAAVHPIARIVHRPTFEKEYETFWDEVSLGIEPPNSVQTIVFAAMFSGVVSMDAEAVIREFGVSKVSLMDNFKLGTETALGRANFLKTTKIETLQAFVMYLIPLCRAELSRAHSVLLGAAIRMAECMGLHRDGEVYGMSPLETHVRRLIWYQLCFLDIRTCESQGPRPTIRRDDFDTKLPLNVDDADLRPFGKPPPPADRWTDTTFSLIRFEANEMMRTIWVDRPRIERRKISLTAVLTKIETFKANMAAKYDHLMNDQVPLQKYAKTVKAVLLGRFHTMVLHRYHNSVISPMPERLRTIMLGSGLTTLEAAISCEVLPEFRLWSWYNGAYQQYHTAFLLLMEVFVYPNRKEAGRIWPCLDYIYECNPLETPEVKGRKILSELQRKTAVYQSMRGMRAPEIMEKRLGQRTPRFTKQTDADLKEKGLLFGPDTSAQKPVPPINLVLPRPMPEPIDANSRREPIQYAGVSNGQSLWAGLPDKLSPESSGDPNFIQQTPPIASAGDDLMADIDWEAFDALFPPQNEATLFQPEFPFPPFLGHGVFPQGNASDMNNF